MAPVRSGCEQLWALTGNTQRSPWAEDTLMLMLFLILILYCVANQLVMEPFCHIFWTNMKNKDCCEFSRCSENVLVVAQAQRIPFLPVGGVLTRVGVLNSERLDRRGGGFDVWRWQVGELEREAECSYMESRNWVLDLGPTLSKTLVHHHCHYCPGLKSSSLQFSVQLKSLFPADGTQIGLSV